MLLRKEQKKKQNDEIFEKIQPLGGITFADSKYIMSGGGYEACIHIYEYPKALDAFWLGKVCNINNTVATVDMGTEDIYEVKKNLNKSMKEQNYRYREATDFQEQYDAQERFSEMQNLFREISSLGEVVKLMHIRIFIADRNWTVLEKKIKNIMKQLEGDGYMPTIFLNETKNEWTSMYKSYTSQEKERYPVYGQPMTSETLGCGNPFHFSYMIDPTGTFLGKTPCGGNVLFDLFTKTEKRRYYNFLCIGTMGSGKSTLLKKQFLDNAIKGNYVRTFDISGEFTELTNVLGGKVIKLDGSSGILNPLEILRAGDDDAISFTRHISKVSTMYKFLAGGNVSTEEQLAFEELLRKLYEKWGFYMENGSMVSEVCGLPADRYPIFSDMLKFIETNISEMQSKKYENLEMEIIKKELLLYDKIRRVIQNLVNTYGNLFNGHTSIDNILDEQIVTFDISTLKELKEEIFDAMIFNMVSLCWDNCVTNGKLMLKKFNSGEIDFIDIIRTLILIDESHRWINTKKLYALELILIYLREARKYFGGIGLASQSIRDYVPENSGSTEIDMIKTIFELTQYKFIFHQDANACSMMNSIFNGELASKQINRIPTLQTGENILCISSDRTLEFKVYLTKEEERIFQGGV